MKKIVKYVDTEMNGMAAKKFNAVDSLVLSQLSYVHFDQMVAPLSRGSKTVRLADLLRAEMRFAFHRFLNSTLYDDACRTMQKLFSRSARTPVCAQNAYTRRTL